jgi:hypothetical protein
LTIEKIISGGQTGPDRAALDVAIAHGIPHGGWCPKGRWAEDGALHDRYNLLESPVPDPAHRTELNVRDSQGTVIFSMKGSLSGGSKETESACRSARKPCLHLVCARDGRKAAELLLNFLREHRIKILNVAGPRASEEPEAGRFATEVLEKVLGKTGAVDRSV